VTFEAEVPEMLFCPLFDKVGLWIKNTVGDIGNSGDRQGSCGKIAFARCLDELLSLVTEDAISEHRQPWYY
jgi:hypothetical protein